MDTLESMFNLSRSTARDAQTGLSCCYELPGETVQFMGYMVPLPDQKFQGLSMCPHCMERAAFLLRDLANTIDDMVAFARLHRVDK